MVLLGEVSRGVTLARRDCYMYKGGWERCQQVVVFLREVATGGAVARHDCVRCWSC